MRDGAASAFSGRGQLHFEPGCPSGKTLRNSAENVSFAIISATWAGLEIRQGRKESPQTESPLSLDARARQNQEAGGVRVIIFGANSTLVVWADKLGRTPMGEFRRPEDAAYAGRDHHANCFSAWLAGGGIRPGLTVGRTDDLGLSITEDPVHLNDLQATILHCLGFDHTRLTYHPWGGTSVLRTCAAKL